LIAHLIYRKALRVASRQLQADFAQEKRDFQADLAQFMSEICKRIEELEQTISDIKVDCAALNIDLVPLKAQSSAPLMNSSVVPTTDADTWMRDAPDLSIVPKIEEGQDTWIREGGKTGFVEQPTSASLLAKVLTSGNNSAAKDS